jgi:broad specificity phosphatase PhoE
MIPRKTFFQQILTSGSFVVSSSLTPQAVEARGLVQFPCEAPLFNTYHLMCAGESLLEEGDILTTNPLFLTNREAALSPKGISQVQETCHMLEENNVNPSIIKYSLAASAMDTTSIVKDALKVGQNRIIPEFTFMDPRAIGKWDMMSASETKAAVIALDELEAGTDGRGGRPPPNEDGTPNETLQDQSVRLVQLISGTSVPAILNFWPWTLLTSHLPFLRQTTCSFGNTISG